MQVKLSSIKSSPQPVRTSRDEAKIVELVESIGEYGLLQAIEVRPAGSHYEIVFGNRRIEACRRLGHTHIEAVVTDLNDSTALIHGLIENVVREDLGALDKARGIRRIQEITSWTVRELAQYLGMHNSTISQFLALLREPEEIQQLMAQPTSLAGSASNSNVLTESHVRFVRREKLPEEQHIQILQKAAKEGLTAQQARVEARILKVYGTEEQQETRRVVHEQQEVKDDEQRWWNYQAGEGAKNLLRSIKVTRESFKHSWLIVERGAIGPEHMPFLEKRIRNLASYLIELADDLDARRREAIGE